MRILVDTNVLVRSAHVGSRDQAVATAAVRKLRDQRHELRTVPQVLYEYWAVASRATAQNGLGFNVEDVAAQVSGIQILFPTLRDERGILGCWEELALDFKVQGKQAHDARLAAAMQRHGLSHLLTFNVDDFKRYPRIQIIEPRSIVAAS